MTKLTTNVGAFVGFLYSGKLLLVRRTQEGSILPGISFKGNWELPGGALEEADVVEYDYLIQMAFRKAEEKVGIHIPPRLRPILGPVYSTFFKGPSGYDLACVVPFATSEEPKKGETVFVSPLELKALALEFVSETDAKK
ncbi:MAG: NUDIX domain-containing protein [bacterium]|nr:NUDIX domain-containing protein [bacterium]